MKMLYDRYAGYLSAVCARYIPEDSALKDILQECFIRIFQSMGRFEYRGEGSLKAWMTRIVVNGALKTLERRRYVPLPENISEIEDFGDESAFPSIPMPVLQQMIRELPDGYRTVFNLYVFENMSHKDIARLTGIKENSSASQLHHAKALLRKRILQYIKQKDYE